MSEDPKKRLEREERLIQYAGPDQIITSHEAFKDITQSQKQEVIIGSGFPTVDRWTEGFQGGELYVVSGPTKHGKTTWCQTITRNLSQSDQVSLWFSYELPKRQFILKFPNLPHFVLPNQLKGRAISWIDDRILEAKLKHNARVVFIDHLHFLVDMEQIKNPSLQIGALVRKLKGLTMEHNIILFLICHLTKIKFDEEPTENDLRDSSFIAQDADGVFMIYRIQDKISKEFKNEATLTIRNHRRTGVMAKKIPLVYVGGWLEEGDYEYRANMDERNARPPF